MRVAAIAFAAVLVRLLIVAVTDGGADLSIYTFFGSHALHGTNPYDVPPGGIVEPRFADSPPLEFALFAALLWIHDSEITLRLVFPLFDAATILLIGLAWPRPQAWRLRVILFYAFNPFVLAAWTAFSEDKTLLFLLIAATLLALERGRLAWAWAWTALLSALKFLGAFFAPVLALETLRRDGRRGLLPIAAGALFVAASCLLWFPDSLGMLDNRRERATIAEPIHASPMMLLHELGLYATWLPQVLMVVSLLGVIALWWSERVDVREAVALSIAAGYVYLPDAPSNRILLILLPFLLLSDLSPRQWALVWLSTLPAAACVASAAKDLPQALDAVLGELGSLGQVMWLNLPFVVVFGLWIRERSRKRAKAVSVSA